MKPLRWVGLRTASGASILLASFLLLLPFPAWAALGDNAASVLTDQARMKGTLHSTDNRTYVLHEITMSSGAKVREFVTPGGAVFGVAWEGQFPTTSRRSRLRSSEQLPRHSQTEYRCDVGAVPW